MVKTILVEFIEFNATSDPDYADAKSWQEKQTDRVISTPVQVNNLIRQTSTYPIPTRSNGQKSVWASFYSLVEPHFSGLGYGYWDRYEGRCYAGELVKIVGRDACHKMQNENSRL